MRPIRLALPLCLLLGPGFAVAGQQPVPPAVPPSPGSPTAAMAAAWRAARDGDALVVRGRYDDAIAHFRRSVEAAPAGAEYYAVNSLHAFALGRGLIDAGRLDEADRELAWFIGRAPPMDLPVAAGILLRLNDLRLYLAAGRGEVEQVLALLDGRMAFRGRPNGGCPAARYFPEVVAPAHHDPRVAAKLRALGCGQSIIDQLDDLASRPIGSDTFDPGLPPR